MAGRGAADGPSPGEGEGRTGGRFPIRVTEKTFKRLTLLGSVGGVVLIAVGLNEAVFRGNLANAVACLIVGGLLGTIHYFLEPIPQPRFSITLYTRKACGLCEEAEALLRGFSERYGFDVWLEDVDEDAALAAKYGDKVPVAVAKGETLFELGAEPARLERRLEKLARGK